MANFTFLPTFLKFLDWTDLESERVTLEKPGRPTERATQPVSEL